MNNRADVLAHIRDQLNGRGTYVMLRREDALELVLPSIEARRAMWAARVQFHGETVFAVPTLWGREAFRDCACTHAREMRDRDLIFRR